MHTQFNASKEKARRERFAAREANVVGWNFVCLFVMALAFMQMSSTRYPNSGYILLAIAVLGLLFGAFQLLSLRKEVAGRTHYLERQAAVLGREQDEEARKDAEMLVEAAEEAAAGQRK